MGITFVCCIEAGRLEQETLLLLKTLRRFGGSLSEAPVLVVKARRGRDLQPETLARLASLRASYAEAFSYNERPWFNYSNKVAAVSYANDHARTDQIAWIDSDILVAGEPTELFLKDEEEFVARCEYLPPAIVEGSSAQLPYWRAVCELFGATIDALPWFDLDWPKVRLRLFFNSGIFAWRRKSSFAGAYRKNFQTLLRSRLAMANGLLWYADQVVLAPTVLSLGLKWRHLTLDAHHMAFPGHLEGKNRSPSLASAALIHYSKSVYEPHRATFLKRLAEEQPLLSAAVAADIAAFGERKPPISARLLARRLRQKWLQWRAIPVRV